MQIGGGEEKATKKQLRTRISLISSYNKTVETEKEREGERKRQSDIKTNRERDWLMIAYIALVSALLSRLIALACGFSFMLLNVHGGEMAY